MLMRFLCLCVCINPNNIYQQTFFFKFHNFFIYILESKRVPPPQKKQQQRVRFWLGPSSEESEHHFIDTRVFHFVLQFILKTLLNDPFKTSCKTRIFKFLFFSSKNQMILKLEELDFTSRFIDKISVWLWYIFKIPWLKANKQSNRS